MRRNNFDKSSSGTDIEFVGFMDCDSSRRDFEENIEIIQHDGYRTTSIGYYIDAGNVPDSSEVKFTVKGERTVKEKYLVDTGRNYDAEDVSKWDDETIDNEILSQNKDATLINYAMSLVSSRHGYFQAVNDGLEIEPTKNLIAVEIRGYSQGDYAIVLYCPEDVEKAWGNLPNQSKMKEMFTHWYYDAPVYAVMTINGEEYNFWEFPHDNSYEWDKDKFVKWVSEQSKIPVETIAPFVPEDLDYQ